MFVECEAQSDHFKGDGESANERRGDEIMASDVRESINSHPRACSKGRPKDAAVKQYAKNNVYPLPPR